MIKVIYGNEKEDEKYSPWKPMKNNFTMCNNLTAASVLLTMVDGLKKGDYIILQLYDEDNM